jgi:phage shock protein PspC (stress-responsive transcriptional regulator)
MWKYAFRIWLSGFLIGIFLLLLFRWWGGDSFEGIPPVSGKLFFIMSLVGALFSFPFFIILLFVLPSIRQRAKTADEARFKCVYTTFIIALLPLVALTWFSSGGYFGIQGWSMTVAGGLFFCIPATLAAWFFYPSGNENMSKN